MARILEKNWDVISILNTQTLTSSEWQEVEVRVPVKDTTLSWELQIQATLNEQLLSIQSQLSEQNAFIAEIQALDA